MARPEIVLHHRLKRSEGTGTESGVWRRDQRPWKAKIDGATNARTRTTVTALEESRVRIRATATRRYAKVNAAIRVAHPSSPEPLALYLVPLPPDFLKLRTPFRVKPLFKGLDTQKALGEVSPLRVDVPHAVISHKTLILLKSDFPDTKGIVPCVLRLT